MREKRQAHTLSPCVMCIFLLSFKRGKEYFLFILFFSLSSSNPIRTRVVRAHIVVQSLPISLFIFWSAGARNENLVPWSEICAHHDDEYFSIYFKWFFSFHFLAKGNNVKVQLKTTRSQSSAMTFHFFFIWLISVVCGGGGDHQTKQLE